MDSWNRLDSRLMKYWEKGKVRYGREESDFKFVLFQWQKWGSHFGEESEVEADVE